MNIVAEAQLGSPQAWDTLYRAVTPKLIVFIRAKGIIDTFESEEDLVGDTWIVIAQKIHEFKGKDISSFTNWAFTIANNHLLNSNHKAIRRKTEPTNNFAFIAQGEWDQDWLAAEEMLKLLSPKDREIVVLVDLLGFTSKDAGKILGMSASNIRVSRSRALKNLRKVLASD